MYNITSKMTLSEKLRAHASNIVELDPLLNTDAAWVMRDAANVIVTLNSVINELEDKNERLGYRQAQMGERQE